MWCTVTGETCAFGMDDLWSAAVGVVFNEAVRRMVGAFRKRALEVYGPPVATGAAPRGRQS